MKQVEKDRIIRSFKEKYEGKVIWQTKGLYTVAKVQIRGKTLIVTLQEASYYFESWDLPEVYCDLKVKIIT